MSFAVLSLPRSRTAWLSAFFNSANLNCEHELIAKSNSFDEAIEKMNQGIGSVDTGQIFIINDIQERVKNLNVIIIERDKEDVKNSFRKLNIGNVDSFIERQSELLAEEKKSYPSFNYEDIDDRIEEIWTIVSGGLEFPKEKYEIYKNYKIEIADIKSYTIQIGVERILKNYGILKATI
jgi:hypothetical protein